MKQKITLEQDLYLSELNGKNIDEIIEYLSKFKTILVERAMENSEYDFTCYDYYAHDSKFTLIREETDIEYEQRLEYENGVREEAQKAFLDKEKKEYERLKAKFEK